jgi:hypothetical protein
MDTDLECDLLVLGTGLGGYSAAFRAASDFFQYFNPSSACLQVIDLIEFFLSRLSPILKNVTL